MKFIVLILLLWQIALHPQSGANHNSVYDFDLKISHLLRDQFYTLNAVYPVYGNFIIEAEYGYLYYHRAGLSIGYRFHPADFTTYLTGGAVIQRENFTKNTHYTETSLKFGGGIETRLTDNFYFSFETAITNYINIDYSMRKIKFRENYEAGEFLEYTVAAALGYRFHF